MEGAGKGEEGREEKVSDRVYREAGMPCQLGKDGKVLNTHRNTVTSLGRSHVDLSSCLHQRDENLGQEGMGRKPVGCQGQTPGQNALHFSHLW